MTDAEIVEIAKLYKASSPIKIPLHQLDPNFAYRWIGKSVKNFRRRRGIGWTPVTKAILEEVSKVPIADLHMGTHFDPDGHLSIADDLVFAYIPKRTVDAIAKAHQLESQARMRAGKQAFHETGQLAGVQTFDKSG